MKTRWTKGARADLRDIVAHISRDRPRAARQLAHKIRGAVAELVDFPEMGRQVPEFGDPTLRERVVRPYRVIYRLTDSEIRVLAVVHGRRSLDPLR